ncbi:MAG: hypothetical protein WDA65_03800 [Christensenellales bacterium]
MSKTKIKTDDNNSANVLKKAIDFLKARIRRVVISFGIIIIISSGICFFHNELAYFFAECLYNIGDKTGAKGIFVSLGDFNGSKDYLIDIDCALACDCMSSKDYQSAVDLLIPLNDGGSPELLNECYLLMAEDYYKHGDFGSAASYFLKIDNNNGARDACAAWADKLFNESDYAGAIDKIKPYSGDIGIDTRIMKAEYELACIEAAAGDNYAAVVKLNRLKLDERAREAAIALMCADPESAATLAVSDNHIVYLTTDGSVHAGGSNFYGQCDVDGWVGVVSLCASELNTFGLVYNGTALAAGSNAFGQCDISDWTNIRGLCASDNAVFGLKRDGTVVFAGGERGQYDDVSEWTDIVLISAGKDHIAAADKKGNAFTAGKDEYGQCRPEVLSGIASVSCGPFRTILVTAGGSVNICGVCSDEIKNKVETWTNITSVSSSRSHIVAQNSSGKLFAAGENNRGQCGVFDWKDVVFFFARADFTIGVTADGRVLTSVEGHTLDWEVLIW